MLKKSLYIVFILSLLLIVFCPFSFGYTAPLLVSGTKTYEVTADGVSAAEHVADGKPFYICTNFSDVWIFISSSADSYFYIQDNLLYSTSGSYSFATFNNNVAGSFRTLSNGGMTKVETDFSYYYTSDNIMRGSSGTDVFFSASDVSISYPEVDANHFLLQYNGSDYLVLRNLPEPYSLDTDAIFVSYRYWSNTNRQLWVYLLKNAKVNNANGGSIYSNYNGRNMTFYNRYDDGSKLVYDEYTTYYAGYDFNTDSWGDFEPQVSNFYVEKFFTFTIYSSNYVYLKSDDSILQTPQGYAGKPPYVANTDAQLQGLTVGELALNTYNIAPSLLNVYMSDDTTDEMLWTINLKDYDKYISRIDLEDPFSDLGYVIPWKDLPPFDFVENHQYTIYISYATNVDSVSRRFVVTKSISNTDIPSSHVPVEPEPTPTPDPNAGLIESNKETQNILNDQTNAIKENTETNKNIFQKIGDILSFINPFSENFFGRKLVELIIDGIKGLFVPEDDFFSNYFEEIKNWFSDRLGFLWAPFDLLINILNRMLNINFSEPTFNIPDIYEPFTNQKIISSQDFNFNSMLENKAIKTVHDIYLILVDAFIVFNLYKLAQEKLEEVFTK